MAVRLPKFGPVVQRISEDLFTPDVLKAYIPGIGDVLEGAALVREVNEEINTLGKLRGRDGFASAKCVSKIDTSIMIALDELHEADCTCRRPLWGSGGHRDWFFAWLKTPEGQAFDTRGKVTI